MNEEKNELLETFNNHFCECVGYVHNIFPQDITINTMLKSVNMLLMISKKKIIRFFKSNIVDIYSKQIETGDMTFFINKDYKADVSVVVDNNDFIINHINYIKSLVVGMNEEQQKNIMKYFKNLVVLCKLYHIDE